MAISKPQIDSKSPYIIDTGADTKTLSEKAEVSKLYLVIKRIVDVIGAILGLILMGPVFVIISFLYLFGSQKGPVFFKQQRIGKDGKPFYIYKFRSMVVNAEERLKSNKELYQKYVENSFKLEPDEDPRITKAGRFLRRTSLDELPQLINVIRGDMSIVGPRPIIQEELINYQNQKDLFLSVKPGITGYWQAYGRSNVEYPQRVEMELKYIKKRSLLFDLKLILATVRSVILRKGAY